MSCPAPGHEKIYFPLKMIPSLCHITMCGIMCENFLKLIIIFFNHILLVIDERKRVEDY